MTYRQLVYMVLDELKLQSDDANFNEDHIIFLLDKYRVFLLKQRYSDIKKQIPESNFQTLCLDLEEVPAISGEPCEGGSYLKSTVKIPNMMTISNPKVYPIDYYQGSITYVTRDRMRYVGYNKYLSNIIYCSLGPDNYLYFKSSNPQYLYLQKVKITGIFEDASEVAEEALCEGSSKESCDSLDMEFPLESGLVPPIIELIVKDLSSAIYKPEDKENDAQDNLSDVSTTRRYKV